MRRTSLCFLGVVALALATTANVFSVKGNEVEFFLSAEDGIKIGQQLSVLRNNELVGILEVTFVGSLSSRAKVIWQKENIQFKASDIVSTKKFNPPAGMNPVEPEKANSSQPESQSKEEEKKASSPPPEAQPTNHPCRVHLKVADKVLLNCGKNMGLKEGEMLSLLRDGKEVAQVKVEKVLFYHSIASVTKKSGKIAWGDQAKPL